MVYFCIFSLEIRNAIALVVWECTPPGYAIFGVSIFSSFTMICCSISLYTMQQSDWLLSHYCTLPSVRWTPSFPPMCYRWYTCHIRAWALLRCFRVDLARVHVYACFNIIDWSKSIEICAINGIYYRLNKSWNEISFTISAILKVISRIFHLGSSTWQFMNGYANRRTFCCFS